MNVKDKKSTVKNQLSDTVKKTAAESQEAVVELSENAIQQTHQVLHEAKENLINETEQLATNVQNQVQGLKKDVLDRIDFIKEHVDVSQKDLTELRAFLKAELNLLWDELNKFGKELKADVSQISMKHKTHIADTFKRSKAHTVDAWHKVSTKQ